MGEGNEGDARAPQDWCLQRPALVGSPAAVHAHVHTHAPVVLRKVEEANK